MRTIVSTVGSPTYNVVQHLANIVTPLAGRSKSFVKNSLQFVQKIDGLHIPDNTIIVSFDVKSLFTNIPIWEALHVIRKRLEFDATLVSPTSLGVGSIMKLLHLCLTTAYFIYEGQYYQENDRASI